MEGVNSVLRTWFGDAPENAEATMASRHGLWFGKSPEVDADLRQRYLPLLREARHGACASWAASPRGALALLLLLDQLPRNIFRGGAEAFASDAQALRLALAVVDAGDDARLWPIERVFVYLPLEHAEDLAVQQRAVALFTALRDAMPTEQRQPFDGFLDYAVRHRDVIARFGRFPHRNDALGRASSEAEQAYLRQPGAGF
ncbi:MAG: hypothetical protein B7X46_12750 [Thiomonas sp. 15-66-11]|nr:MAG: hypothetical protein B7X46_12750 [Thiomonas sp. 15-66-11]